MILFEAKHFTPFGLEVFDQDVGISHKPFKVGQSFLRFQIQDHATLVTVGRHEGRALTVDEGWGETHVVADIRAFDFDHVGALIGQNHRAVGAG